MLSTILRYWILQTHKPLRFGFGLTVVGLVAIAANAALYRWMWRPGIGAFGVIATVAGVILMVAACAVFLVREKIAPHRVDVDDVGIRRYQGSQLIEVVRWCDLVRVSIMTTDQGPLVEDFFWLFFSAQGNGCAIGSDDAVRLDLLLLLQTLPGFNNTAVILASGSTGNAEFEGWHGEPGTAAVVIPDARSTKRTA